MDCDWFDFSMCLESLKRPGDSTQYIHTIKGSVGSSGIMQLLFKLILESRLHATIASFLLLYSWPALIPMYVLSLLQVVSQEIALKL